MNGDEHAALPRAWKSWRSKPQREYPRYDPNDGQGRGSPEQWSRAATGGSAGSSEIAALAALGLSPPRPPWEVIRRAYRSAIRRYHPDKGGTHEEAARITNAYSTLKGLARWT